MCGSLHFCIKNQLFLSKFVGKFHKEPSLHIVFICNLWYNCFVLELFHA